MFKDILKGFIIGTANVIPGVSGGTMALVLGIYDRLIRCLNSFDISFLKSFFSFIFLKKGAWISFREHLIKSDIAFLARLSLGGAAAVIGLAKVMENLLNNHHDPTYGFFFGLVLVSVYEPFKLVKKWNFWSIAMFFTALALILFTSLGVSDEQLVKRAEQKALKNAGKLLPESTQDLLKKPLQELSPGLLKKPLQESSQGLLQMPDPVKTEALSNNPDSGPVFWESFIYPAKFFLFGALAITAMLLPGISGSFVLLLLGAYFEILGAVNTRDYFLVLVFGAGCAAGILVFGRIIEYLLKKYSNSTMAFMTGLVAGSLYVIWPFKKTVMIFDKTVYLSNTLPGAFNTNFIYTVISFAAGTVLVLLSIKLSASEKSSS